MRYFLAALLFAAFAPSLASAASDVNLEITNKTKSPLVVTSVKSKCMEIPYRTELPPGKLTIIRIQWNSYGSCKLDSSYTDLGFTDNTKRIIGQAELFNAGRLTPNWTLKTSGNAGFCLPRNGYDQIAVHPC